MDNLLGILRVSIDRENGFGSQQIKSEFINLLCIIFWDDGKDVEYDVTFLQGSSRENFVKKIILGPRVVNTGAPMSNIKELCIILGPCWCFRA